MAKKIKLIAFLVIVVNICILYLVFVGTFGPKPVPLPTPNGYDAFVEAGKLLSPNTSAAYGGTNVESLALAAAQNAGALRKAREGLSQRCLTPVEHNQAYVAGLSAIIQGFKNTAEAFAIEGKVAELQGRTNDAVECYLEGIRFSQECSRGGIIISRLVGIACESICMRPLQRLVPKLDSQTSRATAKALEEICSQFEPVTENLRAEKAWASHSYGLKAQFAELINFKQQGAVRARFEQRVAATKSLLVQLTIEMSARAYELDHGNPPPGNEALVPDYLSALPKYPDGNTNRVIGVTSSSH